MILLAKAAHRAVPMFGFIALSLAVVLIALTPAFAADPVRIGLSLSLTGPTSPAGKQVLGGER